MLSSFTLNVFVLSFSLLLVLKAGIFRHGGAAAEAEAATSHMELEDGEEGSVGIERLEEISSETSGISLVLKLNFLL